MGDHVRCHILATEPHTLEVNVDHRVPLILGHLLHACIAGNTGVIYQNINATAPLVGAAHGHFNRLGTARVEENSPSLTIRLLDLGCYGLSRTHVNISDHDPRTLTGKGKGGLPTNSLSPTSDNRNFVHETHNRLLLYEYEIK